MNTILDYIRWRGDVPLAFDGIRDADALVLSLLSYLDLKPLWTEGVEALYLRDCQKMVDDGSLRVLLVAGGFDYNAIAAAAIASRRFGALRITDYVDLLREDPPLQFAAMCFHDESGLSFLAYRGTDNTLSGWEEDFLIGVTRTEAQQLALAYADRHLREERRWYLGGHSKGANLALYAACGLPRALLKHVERIYILDGPGLCPEVMDAEIVRRVDRLCRRIIPSFSVVGKLFEPKITDSHIVKCTVSGFMQHSLACWGLDYGELVPGETDPSSVWINNTLRDWINNMPFEDRRLFIRELFEALAAGGAHRLDELDDAGPAGFEAIMRRLLSSSEVTRKTLNDLPAQAVNQAMTAASRLTENLRRSAEAAASKLTAKNE